MENICGCRLTKVGLTIGWFTLIVGLIFGILLSVAFERLDYLVQIVERQILTPHTNLGIRNVVISVICLYFFLSVVDVITSFLLILGTVKKRHRLLIPWLVCFAIFIILNAALFMYILYLHLRQSMDFQTSTVNVTLILIGLGLVFDIVLWILIYMLLRQITSERNQSQQNLITDTVDPQDRWI
ncbi:uncharacterized protein LOC142238795 [Haematobia irritans]|uniref:uncharacterized protein LOC142238795 n=1 Tax=Haematobia irritans TaxID=7368 RepID=UPI003F50297D